MVRLRPAGGRARRDPRPVVTALAAVLAVQLAVQLGVGAVVVLTRASPVTAPLPSGTGTLDPLVPAPDGDRGSPLLAEGLGGALDGRGVPVLGGVRPPAATGAPARVVRPRVAPRVRVPALGVDAAVVPLGTGPDGALQVPATATDVGVWAAGPQPGDPGAAVLVGHVDLDGRPGVFARLATLRPGDLVSVRRADGAVARFRVERVERVAKTAFPTEAVYAPTAEPVLRLVTCGGAFDERTGHYRDNVVVFASAV